MGIITQTGNCGAAELGCALRDEQTHDIMSEVGRKVMCCGAVAAAVATATVMTWSASASPPPRAQR